MLINPECVAQAPSRPVALAPSRRAPAAGSRGEAGFGPAVVLRQRGWAGPATGAGRNSGIWCGESAAAGYLPGAEGSFRLGQRAVSFGESSVVTNSTAYNSTNQHNNMQVARLLPALKGEVGPHPEREPGPA
jgi:hypothetical protein